MSSESEFAAALRDLGTAELVVLGRMWLDMSSQAVDNGRPRVSHAFHVLSVSVAEEQDMRQAVIDAMDADVDGSGVPGALVGDDDDELLEQVTAWTIDHDADDDGGEPR